MKVLIANTADDISNWPCAYSVFTGISCNGKYCNKCGGNKDETI